MHTTSSNIIQPYLKESHRRPCEAHAFLAARGVRELLSLHFEVMVQWWLMVEALGGSENGGYNDRFAT